MRAWAAAIGDRTRLSRGQPGSRCVAALWTRWLGFIFASAFLTLCFEMEGLVGPRGILPARDWLHAVAQVFPGVWRRLAFAPSLLWLGAGSAAIHWLCAIGLAASLVLLARFHPRLATAVCLICFLSFLAVAQVFANYQSDGMLMTAGLITLFLDARHPSWWSLFSLRWLWFTIYFGSGIAKLLSGDPQWRHLTALGQYYQNAPLPSRLGWYAQQYTPHLLAHLLALSVLVIELGIAWLCFGPRRARILCFWLTTPLQIAIILTANYGFLNFLVLGLGLALLDDRHLAWLGGRFCRRAAVSAPPPGGCTPSSAAQPANAAWPAARRALASLALVGLVGITGANLAHRLWRGFPVPDRLNEFLAPFRITDEFGLFAVMTRAEYELEFQGSADGTHWKPYPFRFKPQDPRRAPGWFGPYQPRFDWNLWFASMDSELDNPWVQDTAARLLQNDPAVLSLFAGNPFPNSPPLAVRVVVWQYWFATPAEKRTLGIWWTRRRLGLYAPAIERSRR